VLKPYQYWLQLSLAAAAIILVVVNAGLYFTNRSAQAQFNARSQYIQQSQSIGSLYQEIAKTLANLAVENHDDEIKALLAQEGFTINSNQSNQAGTKP
jgi:flagellar basal body-associated protein FliL